MNDWAKYWWETITGPKTLTAAVANDLCIRGSVCLLVPHDLPWRNDMRAAVENELHRKAMMDDFIVTFIDVADDCPDVTDVGHFLLERFAEQTVKLGYRKRETIQQYLAKNAVLEKRVLWIKGMNCVQEKAWLKFCAGYTAIGEKDGRFVLEIRNSENETERKNLSVVKYSEKVNSYALSLLNSIYLNQNNSQYSEIWQQYCAEMCATLCDTDAELSIALMQKTDFRMRDPLESLKELSEDDDFWRRGEANEKHVLNRVRSGDTKTLNTLIWKAQLQVLFPLVEMERNALLLAYRDELDLAIHEQYLDYSKQSPRRIHQFGEVLEDVNDIELGTLHRMTRLRKFTSQEQYLFYLPDDSARNRLELLHDVRNNLAHGKPCTVEQVNAFIDGFSFAWK